MSAAPEPALAHEAGSTPRLASPRAAAAIFAALLALPLALPLLWPVPWNADLPNHWARLSMLAMPAGDPLNAFYEFKFGVIPNLAMELIYFVLHPLLSPQAMATLAWALAVVLPATGAWRLSGALHGRPQLAALLAPLSALNLPVSAGLLNFAVGMGIMLHALALWFSVDRRRFWTRLALFNAAGVALFFCHAAAYAAFVLAIGLIEAAPRRGDAPAAWLRRACQALACVGPPALLWFLAEALDARVPSASSKMLAVFAPFWTGIGASDLVAAGGALAVLCGALLERRLFVEPRLCWALAGFAALALAIPSGWASGGLLDARIAISGYFLALAALRWEWRLRDARVVVPLIAALCLVRVALQAPEWRGYDQKLAEFRAEIAAIEPGGRALVIQGPLDACPQDLSFVQNLSAFVAIDRRALVSTLFTGAGMQPLRLRASGDRAIPWTPVQAPFLMPGAKARTPEAAALLQALGHWRDDYGWIVDLHAECAWRPDALGLTKVAGGDVADLYRVK